MRVLYKEKVFVSTNTKRETSTKFKGENPGAFLFKMGTVIADDNISKILRLNPKFMETIEKCIRLFKSEEYGKIPNDEVMANTKIKHFGDGIGMFACYQTKCGILRVDTVECNNQLYTLLSLGKTMDNTSLFNSVAKSKIKGYIANCSELTKD